VQKEVELGFPITHLVRKMTVEEEKVEGLSLFHLVATKFSINCGYHGLCAASPIKFSCDFRRCISRRADRPAPGPDLCVTRQIKGEVEVARSHLDALHEEASQLEAEMRSTERQLAEQREAASRLQDEMDQREVHLSMRAQVPRAAPEAEVSQNVLSFVLFGAVVFEILWIPHFIDH
jgi:hypothetical protein